MAGKRKAQDTLSSPRPRKRARFGFRSKYRSATRTQMKRKRRYKKRSRPNNKRLWRSRKRILKGSLSSQPYFIDTATQYQPVNVSNGQVAAAGLSPIGVYSGYVAAEGDWPYPSLADDDTASLSDMARIAFKLGLVDSSGNFLDQGQKVLINYSKVQYNIRNNTNIALNLRIFHFSPRTPVSVSVGTIDRFASLWAEVIADAGVASTKVNPLTHPTDFQRFNKFYKIRKQQNVRLLPGENIFISNITLKNTMMNSSILNKISVPKYGRFLGILFNGDPVHSTANTNNVTNSHGRLDITAAFKLKFRRLLVPSVQNAIHADNDFPVVEETDEHHNAIFANAANLVGY